MIIMTASADTIFRVAVGVGSASFVLAVEVSFDQNLEVGVSFERPCQEVEAFLVVRGVTCPLAAFLVGAYPLAAFLVGAYPLAAFLVGAYPLVAFLVGAYPLAAFPFFVYFFNMCVRYHTHQMGNMIK
jgi:hypothetical protein